MAAPKRAGTAKRAPKARRPVEVTDPVDAELVEADSTMLPAFTMFGQEWTVQRKPPALMLSRMGRITLDDMDAIGVFDEMVELCLGAEQHRRFLRAYYAAAPEDGNDRALLQETVGAILTATTGRPTP